MCQRLNSHTPGLHSTAMLSHDKLLYLSLISNLLPPLFHSVFHTKWACFARSLSAHGRQTRISHSLAQFSQTLTNITEEVLHERREEGSSAAPIHACIDLCWSLNEHQAVRLVSCYSSRLLMLDVSGLALRLKVTAKSRVSWVSFKTLCSEGHTAKESRPPCS